jgi:hypothetical protein
MSPGRMVDGCAIAGAATRSTSRPAGSIRRMPVKYASSVPWEKACNLRRSGPAPTNVTTSHECVIASVRVHSSSVRPRLVPTAAICLLLTSILDAQRLIFSHRVYAAKGRSYQQVWIWSAESGMLTQISHAERDHRFPTCDSDGRHILFDDQENGLKTTRWRLDRMTGSEQPLNAPGISLNFAREATPSSAPTACDAGTARVSPDGTRVACAVKGTDILIADTRTLQDMARVPFGQHYSTGEPYAPWPMESLWSPDGHTLLVGNYGENGSSTTSELDYFLLDITTRTWAPAFTGTDALWLTPRFIAYVTPRDLSPLPDSRARSVWTAHLTAFDPVVHRARPITSGLSNDLSPAVCPP